MTDDPEDALEVFTPYVMNRIMARYNRGVEEGLREAGISVPQMRALAVLDERGPNSVNDLSVLTVIKQSTLSRTLDALEELGCVRRETDINDNRVRRMHLTDKGRELRRKVWPQMNHMQEVMLACLSADERTHLNRLLTRILHHTRKHDF